MSLKLKNILVTGGAGYVGAVLGPKLVNAGYNVKVLDLMMYGDDVFDEADYDKSKLEVIKGDLRDIELVKKSLAGVDAVVHLACISNDPSFDLNPNLGRSINLDAFKPLVDASIEAGVKRFIYASSSSVYGVKAEPNVHEGMELEPLTDYSRFKADCEKILAEYKRDDFTTVTIRPATVCGYSPRQRLDVIINILTNHAFHNKKILVFGGEQKRPNIHIQDMTDLYLQLLVEEHDKINGKIFNAGYENFTVSELAGKVKSVVGDEVAVETVETDDNRSYHVSSEKIYNELGFKAKYSIEDAAQELRDAFAVNRFEDSFNNPRWHNIKMMNEINLK